MSMQGKVVVITGSNTGIGLETAVGVAAQGATTVLACRNQAKAEAAANDVVQRTWNDDVHTSRSTWQTSLRCKRRPTSS